ncbi:MAG: hypothetical protein EKK55_07915 [Rhodocyclaceae bacterium]|nr:MAG: hypothetical protein EKK55_07915 [Rhodocyclaceae bacterium]
MNTTNDTCKKKRTPHQQKADMLRSREFRGCYAQVSYWHDSAGIEVFAEDTEEMRRRFPTATKNTQGTLYVAYREIKR